MQTTTTVAGNITKAHFTRTVHEWSRYASEMITIDPEILGQPIEGTAITAYGTELACLRLFYRLRVGRVEYSANLRRWFYVNR